MATAHPTLDLGEVAPLGGWRGGRTTSADDSDAVADALARVDEPLAWVARDGRLEFAGDGAVTLGFRVDGDLPLHAYVPAKRIAHLGDSSFRADHGLRFAYVAGAMANGISSTELVERMGRAGMLAIFGAAGLSPAEVERSVVHLSGRLGGLPWGANLIHSPLEPELEEAVARAYLRQGVRLVSASAYLALTLPLVRYRVAGIHRDADGRVIAPNRVIAKVSRVEVAERFFSPPPADMLSALVADGELTAQQAEWASRIPVAQDMTAEADSGGHTDNRPALALAPTMMALRDRKQASFGDELPLRVGVAGGIGTPQAAAAAFALGAAYIETGSVNQACVESGTSDAVRRMLAAAEQADVTMAPAADMFEMGVELQVLKRGTMFPMRAHKLRALYRAHARLADVPAVELERLETQILRARVDEVWEETRAFWLRRDARQVARAEQDEHHRMAQLFRWYLGMSSRWAQRGEAGREIDYQVWCGPAMGAFNEWARGSFLEDASARRVVLVAQNLLHGAAVALRAQELRAQGIRLAPGAVRLRPRHAAELEPSFAAAGGSEIGFEAPWPRAAGGAA